jgi:hypothetical protein
VADQHLDRAQLAEPAALGQPEQLADMGQEAVVVADETGPLELCGSRFQLAGGRRGEAERLLDQDRLVSGEQQPGSVDGELVGKRDNPYVIAVGLDLG